MTLPDYSEYLKKPNMLDYIEKEWLDKPQIHDFHAEVINEVIEKYKIKSAFEIGCGTGNIFIRLIAGVKYLGFDANIDCINMAKNKTGSNDFMVSDIRVISQIGQSKDRLVFTFGFLKHFGLHEWHDIFKKICSLGEYLVFDMPISFDTYDDGTEFHHLWKTMREIKQDIEEKGFEILEIKEFGVEPVFICKKKT